MAGSGDDYNTFITTPTGAFGLVTVDAPLIDTLTEEDENDLRLIAGILAVVLAEYRRRTPADRRGSFCKPGFGRRVKA